MAIFGQDNEDQDKDQQQGTGPVLNSGPSALVSGGAQAPAGGATAPQKGSSSGRFTNISSYLKANQGFNQAGGGLAGKVAGNVVGQANQAKENIGQAKNAFYDSANQNRVQLNQGVVNSAMADPTAFTQDQSNLDAFTKMRDASYKGPQELGNQEVLGANVANVAQTGQQLGSEQGRFNTLRQMFNKPSYSGGQQKLDNLLLQGNKQQAQQLNVARREANQLNNEFQNTSNEARLQAQNLSNEAHDTSNAVNQALAKKQLDEQGAIDNRVKELQAARQDKQNQLKTNLGAGQLSQEDARMFGLNGDDALFNVDATKFIKGGDEINKYNAASADDYSKFGALSKLSGKDNTFLSDAYKDKAGQLGKDYGFDKEAFQSAVNTNRAAFEDEARNTQTEFGGNAADIYDQANKRVDYQNQLSQFNPEFKQQETVYKKDSEGNTIMDENGTPVPAEEQPGPAYTDESLQKWEQLNNLGRGLYQDFDAAGGNIDEQKRRASQGASIAPDMMRAYQNILSKHGGDKKLQIGSGNIGNTPTPQRSRF